MGTVGVVFVGGVLVVGVELGVEDVGVDVIGVEDVGGGVVLVPPLSPLLDLVQPAMTTNAMATVRIGRRRIGRAAPKRR
jgi:hypothetical protein